MLELVIFDCDGVLFDSWRANVAYYNAVLARMGRPVMDPEWERRVHFLASSQVYDEMFGEGSDLAREARRVARETDYSPYFLLMDPAPGLHEVLAGLRGFYRMAMATNRGSTVPEIVRRFGLTPYLEFAVGVRDVERPKPFPDMLLKCLARFGTAPDRAVYVGDSASDLTAAQAAGVHFVACGDLPLPDDAPRNGGPRRLRARSFRDLPQCVADLGVSPGREL